MPTIDWLKQEYDYEYDSGDILAIVPDTVRAKEEQSIGGSYREVFFKAIIPHLRPNAKVFELGPGGGSWSRAILAYIPQGELHTVDFQDVRPWLKPETYAGRLVCHQVEDNSFTDLNDDYFDFFWSMGVLCHCNTEYIKTILTNALPKMKRGGIGIHQYSDWEKLERYGWERGRVPLHFKSLPDDEMWWPRNNQDHMKTIAKETGWKVINADLGLVKRDSIIKMKRI